MTLDDPINARLLGVAEDQLLGFYRHPFAELASRCHLPEPLVHERLRAMLASGVVRRIRQTLQAGNLADGALIAWKLAESRLQQAYDWLVTGDPFTGHVVIRSTAPHTPGGDYRLWTTLKVPPGYDPQKHCRVLWEKIEAEDYRWLPTLRVFALGVGHVRRSGLAVGAMNPQPAPAVARAEVKLTQAQWRFLAVLKRDLTVAEIVHEPWAGRAAEVGLSLDAFVAMGQDLAQQGVLRRFSVFLEHTRLARAENTMEPRCNGLFQWSVPAGREIEAGGQIGRFQILTHAYWREADPVFAHANLFAVAHGSQQEQVLAHKDAIDAHLRRCGIPLQHTAVFWGDQAMVRPSEILPWEYPLWCARMGVDAKSMRSSEQAT